MNKRMITGLAVLAASATTFLPALAEDNIVDKTANSAVQLAALGTGLAIGIPVASVREVGKSIASAHENMTEALAGNGTTDDAPARVLTIVPSIPVGAIIGVVRGVGRGWDNATTNFQDKPFSAESLSLDLPKNQ